MLSSQLGRNITIDNGFKSGHHLAVKATDAHEAKGTQYEVIYKTNPGRKTKETIYGMKFFLIKN